MTVQNYLEYGCFFIIFILLVKPMGLYMYRVYNDKKTILSPILSPLESFIYKVCGINSKCEHNWFTYCFNLIVVSFIGGLLLYAMLRLQYYLPFNPQHFSNIKSGLAFNTALSFLSNTNFQSYSGEASLGYFVQIFGLTVQNFLSAASGMCVAVVLIRAFASNKSKLTIGNFWKDFIRSILYILLPLSFVLACLLLWQGCPDNLLSYIHVMTLEGAHQTIPQGPVAAQEAIKLIGTNGGGFFNTNSAHPYENPTALTNFLEVISMLLITGGFTYTFGRTIKNIKQGWVIFITMLLMFIVGLVFLGYAELHNPMFQHAPVTASQLHLPNSANMEGKDVRFGIAGSVLFDQTSTATATGAVNSMLDSYTSLGGLVAMFNLGVGEIIFGGVGTGLSSMLLYAMLTVFIAGLMVGRSPEYLGKKIEVREMKLIMLALLASPFLVLIGTAITCLLPFTMSSLNNLGPHGFSEIFYAFNSAANNNGSSFSGLNTNTDFYNIVIGIIIILGRFLMVIPTLAIAGSLVKKKIVPETSGTLPTSGPTFVFLLIGTIVIVSSLTFFPAYTLGPVVEHLLAQTGQVFY